MSSAARLRVASWVDIVRQMIEQLHSPTYSVPAAPLISASAAGATVPCPGFRQASRRVDVKEGVAIPAFCSFVNYSPRYAKMETYHFVFDDVKGYIHHTIHCPLGFQSVPFKGREGCPGGYMPSILDQIDDTEALCIKETPTS